MLILRTVSQLKSRLNDLSNDDKTIGFVPTMGALHNGHIELIKLAKAQSNIVVCSIFVNPTQFDNSFDLEKYPRTIDDDCKKLENNNCDIVFIPSIKEMYSEEELELKRKNIEDKSWAENKSIDFGLLDKVMEGAHRQGHFNGVAQVVSKLFRIVNPKKAFFGQKDFQQLAIIKSMVAQLAMQVEIISCPIIRENDGLAMSSRNLRLNETERKIAPLIFKTLIEVKELQKNKTIVELKNYVETVFNTYTEFKLEYFEIANTETLQLTNDYNETKSAVACIAVFLGQVRLIDNIILY